MTKPHVFLSGPPHIGKTTALLRVVESFPVDWAGFITKAVLQQNLKIGLEIVTSGGSRHRVASRTQTGRQAPYTLHESELTDALNMAFSNRSEDSFVYLDEINSLFCQSGVFINELSRLLGSRCVVAVVARKGHPILQDLWKRNDIRAFDLDAAQRDTIPGEIAEYLKATHGNN